MGVGFDWSSQVVEAFPFRFKLINEFRNRSIRIKGRSIFV